MSYGLTITGSQRFGLEGTPKGPLVLYIICHIILYVIIYQRVTPSFFKFPLSTENKCQALQETGVRQHLKVKGVTHIKHSLDFPFLVSTQLFPNTSS